MNVLIEMSVEVYDSLLDKCDQSCAECYTLIVIVWKDDRFRALLMIIAIVTQRDLDDSLSDPLK